MSKIVLVGRRDGRVRSRSDGRRYLLEHKTTGRVSGEYVRQFHTDSQQSLYLWATKFQQDGNTELGGDGYVGTFMNLIELGELPGGPDKRAGKCRAHGVAYSECAPMHNASRIEVVTREPAEMEASRRDARRLAHRYWDAAERWPSLEDLPDTPAEGKFTGECAYCEFQPVCLAGASPDVARNALSPRVWEPVEGYQPGQWLEGGALVVDNSLLRAVASCTRRALLSSWHQLAAAEGGIYLDAGTAVHAALDTYLSGKGYGIAELRNQYEAFDLDARCQRASPEKLHRLRWANVSRIMEAWFETHPVGGLPFEVEATEEGFVVELES